MRFKEFINLQEFRSNKPQANSFDKDALRDMLKFDTKLLNIPIKYNGDKTIVIFEHTIGSQDRFIILTDRKDHDDIVGYMWINNADTNGKYWQVRDVTIFPPYQNQGIGFSLYVKLIIEGYELINGYSLSNEAEKLWMKLRQHVKIRTYNLKTDEISEFDERPKEDIALDKDQKFFWLATSNGDLKESLWRTGSTGEDNFKLWINGDIKALGSFCTSQFGEEGDL